MIQTGAEMVVQCAGRHYTCISYHGTGCGRVRGHGPKYSGVVERKALHSIAEVCGVDMPSYCLGCSGLWCFLLRLSCCLSC